MNAHTQKAAGANTSGGQTGWYTERGDEDIRAQAREAILRTLEALCDLVRDEEFTGYLLVVKNGCYPSEIIIDPSVGTMEQAEKSACDARKRIVSIWESYRGYV